MNLLILILSILHVLQASTDATSACTIDTQAVARPGYAMRFSWRLNGEDCQFEISLYNSISFSPLRPMHSAPTPFVSEIVFCQTQHSTNHEEGTCTFEVDDLGLVHVESYHFELKSDNCGVCESGAFTLARTETAVADGNMYCGADRCSLQAGCDDAISNLEEDKDLEDLLGCPSGYHESGYCTDDDNAWGFSDQYIRICNEISHPSGAPTSNVTTLTADPTSLDCTEKECLGYSLNLGAESQNVLDPIDNSKRAIFNQLPPDCFDSIELSGTPESSLYHQNSMEELLESLETEVGLNGNLRSMGKSLQGSVKFISKHNSNRTAIFHSAFIEQIVKTRRRFLKLNTTKCISIQNLHPEFKDAFQRLDKITSGVPHTAQFEWESYREFFNNWGTHVISSVTIGSKFQRFTSTTETHSNTGTYLEAKVCASIEGNPPRNGTGWAAAGCAGFTKHDKEIAAHWSTGEKSFVKGGSPAANLYLSNHLNDEHTKEALERFMHSALEGNSVIRYDYFPIWNILYYAYQGTIYHQQITNLADAFEQYGMDQACRPIQVQAGKHLKRGGRGGTYVQWMDKLTAPPKKEAISIGCWNNCPIVYPGQDHGTIGYAQCEEYARSFDSKYFSVQFGDRCILHNTAPPSASEIDTCQRGGTACLMHVYELEVGPGRWTHRCKAAKTGCNYGEDCHSFEHCHCYGPTCIAAQTANPLRNGGYKSHVKTSYDPEHSMDYLENDSCYSGAFECFCNQDWPGLPEREIFTHTPINLRSVANQCSSSDSNNIRNELHPAESLSSCGNEGIREDTGHYHLNSARECIQNTFSLSHDCANCFAVGQQHIRIQCMEVCTDWCSSECLDCTYSINSDIRSCAGIPIDQMPVSITCNEQMFESLFAAGSTSTDGVNTVTTLAGESRAMDFGLVATLTTIILVLILG